jgi:hypothetical protein
MNKWNNYYTLYSSYFPLVSGHFEPRGRAGHRRRMRGGCEPIRCCHTPPHASPGSPFSFFLCDVVLHAGEPFLRGIGAPPTHEHTQTHMHRHAHTRTHTHSLSLSLACTAHTHARKRTLANARTNTHTHTHTHTHIHTYPWLHTHLHTHTHARTHARTQARTHTQTERARERLTRTHRRTHTRTHPHPHPRACMRDRCQPRRAGSGAAGRCALLKDGRYASQFECSAARDMHTRACTRAR